VVPASRTPNRSRLDLRVVILENPTLLLFVVGIKDSKALRLLSSAFFLAPYTVVVPRVLHAIVIQIVRVRNQRLPFRKEDSSECRASLSFRVCIKDISDVQVPRGHELANIAVGGKQVSLSIQRSRLLGQLIRKFPNTHSFRSKRVLIGLDTLYVALHAGQFHLGL